MKIAEIRQGFSYQRVFPKNYSEKDVSRFTDIRICNVDAFFIEKLSKVKAVQYYLFSGIRILEDFCIPIQRRGQIKIWKQWIKLQFFSQFKIEEAIWVSDFWSKNYFHWVLECLPRILAVRKYGINAPLLLPSHIYEAPYVKSSLEDFGIETITYNFKQTVLVRTLYLPSHDSPCSFDPFFIKNVVKKFTEIDQQIIQMPFRKIFISRKDAVKRRILNEFDLIPILKDSGFEVIQMEKLSFRQQRELMRETRTLFSIHGAGLTNLIFLSQASKVIELHPDTDRYNSCFYHLAASLDIDYYYCFEESDHLNPQEANILVDLGRIRNLLSSC